MQNTHNEQRHTNITENTTNTYVIHENRHTSMQPYEDTKKQTYNNTYVQTYKHKHTTLREYKTIGQ